MLIKKEVPSRCIGDHLSCRPFFTLFQEKLCLFIRVSLNIAPLDIFCRKYQGNYSIFTRYKSLLSLRDKTKNSLSKADVLINIFFSWFRSSNKGDNYAGSQSANNRAGSGKSGEDYLQYENRALSCSGRKFFRLPLHMQ
ncbi:MAG: hypothetical protein D3909_14300 [Candidatus Electrothrix sp. ATG1]|nr:hypothetical protein [Candidatus Electrothrix sp. ATG1]